MNETLRTMNLRLAAIEEAMKPPPGPSETALALHEFAKVLAANTAAIEALARGRE